MAVRIRSRRMGAKKRPFYRLVVADSRSPRMAALSRPRLLQSHQRACRDSNRRREGPRLAAQAQPSDTARRLLEQVGVMEKFQAEKSGQKLG